MNTDNARYCDKCKKEIPEGIGRFTDGTINICMDCNGVTLREYMSKDADGHGEKKSE